MAGLFTEQFASFWEQPLGSTLAIIIVFVGMIFLMFFVARGKTKEQLKLSMRLEQKEKMFRLLAAQSEGICFLYQPEKDEMLLFEKKPNPDGNGPAENKESLIKDFSHEAAEKSKRYFEDFKDFESFVGELCQKKTGIRQKYPLKRESALSLQKYMEVKADYLPDEGKIPGTVVGTIFIKEESSESLDRFDKESGLLKKDVVEKEISYALRDAVEGVRFAFLIFKVKDYKQYTDNFSSDIPGMVDRRIGACMKQLFRENDLMGRVSEDTYVVLMNHITSRDDILKKTENFMDILNKVQRESEGGTLEVNIGFSIYPMDGEVYEELYNKALSALNEACSDGVVAKYCK